MQTKEEVRLLWSNWKTKDVEVRMVEDCVCVTPEAGDCLRPLINVGFSNNNNLIITIILILIMTSFVLNVFKTMLTKCFTYNKTQKQQQ